ncbi:hypothetical protein M1L60_00735 [Actinoplanes sp. TRM 88003]|uniref:Uncharacterized protein n=1 Tax=Paractinoplanes aksuensis TaxID=2939490 RepID=A0ABT1DE64_9ACTN|nr:hypothetical protein [Actinoplanes aksuensis]MCO8269109.1 hypothetical protein [Actinoplanes aksuensis]
MTDDDRAVRILRTMPDDPPLPSTVDVERTMAEGRRRRRVRRWSGGVALVAVTAVAAGGGTVAASALRDTPAAPVKPVTVPSKKAPAKVAPVVPKDCKVTLLPSGEVKKALVTAGDPTGRYHAGRVYPRPGGVHTVVWKDGELLPVPNMPGSDAGFRDINSSGIAVGYSYVGDEERAYALAGGTVRRLAGGRAVAGAINDRGVIAGTLGGAFDGGTPVIWKSYRAEPTRLALPSGITRGSAAAIGEDGTVIGAIYRNTRDEGIPYLWRPDGIGRKLAVPKGATGFWVSSISNGWLYGSAVHDAPDGSMRSFTSYRYSIAANRYEKLAVQLSNDALGAENGWVLSTIADPVILAGKRIVKLPRYNKMKEYQVTAFSADGKTAAGYTTDSTDNEVVANRPLKWTCR